MSRRKPEAHFRVPYMRASFQGGDTQQPLCKAPLFGVCEEFSGAVMTDVEQLVTCKRCLRWLRLGGLSARRARILKEIYRESDALPKRRAA
jgi:hypothetical protein